MIDELRVKVERHRAKSQDHRRKALNATDPAERERFFAAAVGELQTAIDALERGLRSIRRQQDKHSGDACRILEMLSTTYGSWGGTLRDAGDREQAAARYDEGNEYEQERRDQCKAQDSYNLVQRLVVRLLADPSRLQDPVFRAELVSAEGVIATQFKNGRNDSWGRADWALTRFLCGKDAVEPLSSLDHEKAVASFYESTYKAVAALVGEGLDRGGPLGERLEEFRRLLERKLGTPSSPPS